MQLLLEPDYHVHTVSDGTGALMHLERDPSVMLVTSLRMYPMGGRELLERMLARWPYRAHRTVVMTGWPDPHRCVPDGVLVLSKPVRPDLILAVLAKRIGEPITSASALDEPYGVGSLG